MEKHYKAGYKITGVSWFGPLFVFFFF